MLYKYCPWTKEFSRQNIEASVLYFNISFNFNDPFDIYPAIKMNDDEREKALRLFEQEKGISCSLVENFSVEELSNVQRINYKNNGMTSRYGITCFSKENNNIVMWSVYANSHAGYCLGFNIDESDLQLEKFLDKEENQKNIGTYQCKLIPVQYVAYDQRPEWRIDDKDQMADILKTKYFQWAYEKEVRIMVRTDKLYIFPRVLKYRGDSLREIILGANMKIPVLEEIFHVVNHKTTIKIYTAVLDYETYTLNVKPLAWEEIKILLSNYVRLENPQNWLFSYNIFKGMLNRYGQSKVLKCWKSAVKEISMNDVINMMPILSKQNLQSILKNTFDRNVDDEERFQVSLFISYMGEKVKYKLNMGRLIN